MTFPTPEYMPWQDDVINRLPEVDRESEAFADACDQANDRLEKLVEEINHPWGRMRCSADCTTGYEHGAEAGVYAEFERSPEVDRQFVEFLGVMYTRAKEAYRKANPGVRI